MSINTRLFVYILNYKVLGIWHGNTPGTVLLSLSFPSSYHWDEQTRFESAGSPALMKGIQFNSSWLAFLTLLLVFQLLFRARGIIQSPSPASQFLKETGDHFPGLSKIISLPDLHWRFTSTSLKSCFDLLKSINKEERSLSKQQSW